MSHLLTEYAPPSPQPAPRRLGPILLAPGVRPGHAISYMLVALIGIAVVAFIPLMLPFVLPSIGVPQSRFGHAAATLSLAQNITIIACTTVFGALADRIGRRPLLAAACFAGATATFFYPLAASLLALVAISVVIGVSQTGFLVGGATSIMDYPDNASRGKYVSLMLLVQIVGAAVLVGQIGVRLPKMFESFGFTAAESLRFGFWFMSILGCIGLAIALRRLKPDLLPPRVARRTIRGEIGELAENLRAVLRFARAHPPFRLVMIAALTMRADHAVIATFLSLWVASVAKLQGISMVVAVARTGEMYSMVLAGNLISTLIMGYLIDRVNRRRLLIAALIFVVAALLSPLLVRDIFGWSAMAVVLLLGTAEGALIVPAMALLGQEAPEHLRGSASGVFALMGVLGVTSVNLAGGLAFDAAGAMAPFVMMAVLNAGILVAAICIPVGAGRPGAGS